jgi:hypothetical protein
MNNLQEAFRRIDWTLLAEQKKTLLGVLIAFTNTETANNLSGLLHFLDEIQDAAKKDDFPVVFLTEEDDEATTH